MRLAYRFDDPAITLAETSWIADTIPAPQIGQPVSFGEFHEGQRLPTDPVGTFYVTGYAWNVDAPDRASGTLAELTLVVVLSRLHPKIAELAKTLASGKRRR